MALVKKQTSVEFTGRLGNIIYKKRGSVKYISRLPKEYPMPQDPTSVHNRNQYLLISKLAGLINAVDLIKMIWKKEFPECYSSYHEIMIANYPRYNFENLRGNLRLTPNTGFPVPDPSFEIERRKLTLTTAPLSPDTGIDLSIEKYITSATLFLMNSNVDLFPGPCFDARKGNIISLESSSPLTINTKLAGHSVLTSLPDTLVKLWSILITLDEKNNPVRYSDVNTWPPDTRRFLNDDNPNQYMSMLSFPDRKTLKDHWRA